MNKRERVIANRYQQFEDEIHVAYIVQNLRVIKALIRDSLTKDDWKIAYEKYNLDGTLSVSIDMIIIWVATAVLLEGVKRATCDFARSAILTVLERGAKNDDRGRKSFFVPPGVSVANSGFMLAQISLPPLSSSDSTTV